MHDLFDLYKHKIKTADELSVIIGARPREKVVIMCHGVFDIVHPGHIRHLVYAKSKADILIVSITADIHIKKGVHRPHVPHKLRAVNLAAFEAVDYVLIDENAKPINNICKLQPDYFAKGFEYVSAGLNNKTAEEVKAVESYGGEILFTPGDYVNSSSDLIRISEPDLRLEKLSVLMANEKISFEDLRNTVEKFSKYRVHVVGDLIIDSYTYCSMIGGQTKTPTMSVLYENRKDYVGGAGIVAKHLCAAGADVVFSTVLGDDQLKDFAVEDLNKAGVDCTAIIDKLRVTTNKNAIVVKEYRLLKVDTLDNTPISKNIVNDLKKNIKQTSCDAIIFSDFRHGIFNVASIKELTEAIPSNIYKVADSQVASRWGNIAEFKDFDLITPNEREARFSLGDQDSGIRTLAANLYELSKCKTLLLKLGERGILTCIGGAHESLDSFFVLDTFVDNLVDPVGAGDALLAYSTLAMLACKNVAIATIIGSIAAACECEVDGNIPINPTVVLNKINSIERKMKFEE